MPVLPPAVVIHGLEQGRAALACGRPVTLLSAPGAALYAGVMWWIALMDALGSGRPVTDVLDCADAPGRVAEALRAGQRRIVFQAADTAVFPALAAMAEACGAELLLSRPPALDLAARGAERRLTAWLAGAAG